MAKSKVREREKEEAEAEEVGGVISSPAKIPHACHSVCGSNSTYYFFTTSISLLFFSFFSFSEASRSIPTSTLSSSSSPTTYTTASTSKTHHVDYTIIIILTVSSAAFLAFLLVSAMAVLRCFGFKLKRKQTRVTSNSLSSLEGISHEPLDQKDDMAGESGNFSVRKLSWDEIERSTNNFCKVIGSGGYSNVYLARNPSGFWAIKINNGSERLNQVFKQELDILLHLQHPHIVKLLGYCDKQEEGALVFEYVANGNLQDKLHGGESSPVLPWRNRMAIAFQIAQALEYLHEKCPLQIVHMDIKASNILLDQDLNCKLCDFGSAKMGFSSTVRPPSSSMKSHVLTMMGSPGYTDPHYLRTGIASKKNDVYSFGVLVLELVTGMEAFCSEKGQFLTSMVGPRLRDGGADVAEAAGMVDPRLGAAGFDVEEAKTMLSVSAMCLRQSPTLRPSAAQILQTIHEKIPSVSFLQSHQKQIIY
ncbi:unnamed protein product [Prunus armeniaca]|uniref:non-specific serine/threonine protein kinase n=1 Tax=Prunus armeniaca TaxID=36596 RepID=A0A6J5XII0_PRUAR|nr:hypothetical protein GBA52_017090 [Prunus armeniaca]CAB4280365.1 unnamed protein product [Prunus armeniaca]CAB4310778.1 unnamed protein product [Prunus armeniaca]